MTETNSYKTVPWTTVQHLVDRLSNGRTDEWSSTVFSADKKLKAHYKYEGELRFGPAYFHITVTDTQTDKVIWSGSHKNYGRPPSDFRSPFDSKGKYLALVEWLDFSYRGEIPKLIDLENGTQITLTERKGSYLPVFIPTNMLGLVVAEFLVSASQAIFFSTSGEEVFLGKGESHRDCLVADTSIPNVLLVCEQLNIPTVKLFNVKSRQVIKQFELHPNILETVGHLENIPTGKEVTSGDVDLGNLKIGSTSKLSPGDAEGNVWDTLIFDKENDCYYFGIMRASSWGQKDYYRGQEWLQLRM